MLLCESQSQSSCQWRWLWCGYITTWLSKSQQLEVNGRHKVVFLSKKNWHFNTFQFFIHITSNYFQNLFFFVYHSLVMYILSLNLCALRLLLLSIYEKREILFLLWTHKEWIRYRPSLMMMKILFLRSINSQTQVDSRGLIKTHSILIRKSTYSFSFSFFSSIGFIIVRVKWEWWNSLLMKDWAHRHDFIRGF